MTNPNRLRWAAWAVVLLLANLLVFALYLRPDFLLQLSNEIWGCF